MLLLLHALRQVVAEDWAAANNEIAAQIVKGHLAQVKSPTSVLFKNLRQDEIALPGVSENSVVITRKDSESNPDDDCRRN